MIAFVMMMRDVLGHGLQEVPLAVQPPGEEREQQLESRRRSRAGV